MGIKSQTQMKIASQPSSISMQTGLLQRKCACGQHTVASGECEECSAKREGMMQRAAVSPSPVNNVPPIVHDVLSSSGQPLDTGTRAFMEPRFGRDFSQVRVHTDARAAESARAVNALAYTVGRDVVFGKGAYALATSEGRRLMAHELAHTIQQERESESPTTQSYLPEQNDVPRTSIPIDPVGSPVEREAEIAATQIVDKSYGYLAVGTVGSFRLSRTSSLRLQRRTLRDSYATAAFETGPLWDVTLVITHTPEQDSEDVQDFKNACMDGIRDAAASLGRDSDIRTRNIRVTLRYHRGFDYVTVSQEAYTAARHSVLGVAATQQAQSISQVPQTPPTRTEQQPAQPMRPQPTPPKTIIVIGSPSPDQRYQLQFATAAECQAGDANTIWLVERTGYEIYGIPLNYFERYHPPGGYGWITPEHNLVGWLNSMPDHSIGRLIIYSHGVPGNVTLRYGWGRNNLPDYGLNIREVASLNRDKFTNDAQIEFNSCNTGTETDSGNLAQAFANQIGRPVRAWTGRTSYTGINRGTCSVGPSTITGVWEFFKEQVYSRWIRGRTPRLETFQPQSAE
jgi:Domain of unknown function (DUF4157)